MTFRVIPVKTPSEVLTVVPLVLVLVLALVGVATKTSPLLLSTIISFDQSYRQS